ncbi:MAG: alkaline phosphatase family protein [Brachybacterium sp.]
MPHNLLVLSVDGMCLTDLPLLRTLPAFRRLLEAGSFASARSVLPALTYPNHVSLITGRTVSGHGVYGNTKMEPGKAPTDWFWYAEDLGCPTLFDLAKAQGLRTASFFWPGTAGADIDVLVPVVWDPEDWSDPRPVFEPVSSAEAFPALFDKHRDALTWGPGPDYDRFAIALTAEVLAERSAEVVFSHVLAVDKARHRSGVGSQETREALVSVDAGLQVLLEALEQAGTLESTNIVLTSDHGHTDVVQAVAPNVLLAEAGLIRVGADGAVTSWDAWVHPAGLTGQVHLRPGAGEELRARVLELLAEWALDPGVPISAVHSAAQVKAAHGFEGPFIAILEGADATVIQPRWKGEAVLGRFQKEYTGPRSAHGGFPEAGIPPLMIAAGPDITPGVRLEGVSVVDQAATFAMLLGLEIPSADGTAAREMLRNGARSDASLVASTAKA